MPYVGKKLIQKKNNAISPTDFPNSLFPIPRQFGPEMIRERKRKKKRKRKKRPKTQATIVKRQRKIAFSSFT
jgi:hypothetical protein